MLHMLAIKDMKIFTNNLNNNSKTVTLKNKVGDIGKTKYLPSFSKNEKMLFILIIKII